jgi:hypothetical protein
MVDHPANVSRTEPASHGWVVRVTGAATDAVEADVRTFVVGCDTDDEAVAQVRNHATMTGKPRIAALRRLGEDEVSRLDLRRNEVRPYDGP